LSEHFGSVFGKAEDQGVTVPGDFRNRRLLIADQKVTGRFGPGKIEIHAKRQNFMVHQVERAVPDAALRNRPLACSRNQTQEGEQASRFSHATMLRLECKTRKSCFSSAF